MQVAAQFYPDGFEWVEAAPLPLSLGFSSRTVRCLIRQQHACFQCAWGDDPQVGMSNLSSLGTHS
jgi:hypothetical protein